jgi:lipopolysaccharide export system protein LptA
MKRIFFHPRCSWDNRRVRFTEAAVAVWLLLCPWAFLGQAAQAVPSATRTNQMTILADGGFEYESPKAVYQQNVRVFDPQMTLTCELLTVYFETNTPSTQAVRATNAAPGSASQRLSVIVAETNVVMVQKDGRATADRAVYTATNDLVKLTGNARLETLQGIMRCETIYYDRVKGKLYAPGKVYMEGRSGMNLFGTNAFSFGLPGIQLPVRREEPAK